jgi:NADH-quinone oxidoreductase subunit A
VTTIFLYSLGVFVGLLLIYGLGAIIAPYRPNAVKNDHFECGLPPSSRMPKRASFQYFVFAILFIIVDMAGLFFSLFVFSDSSSALMVASMLALILAIAIPLAMRNYPVA